MYSDWLRLFLFIYLFCWFIKFQEVYLKLCKTYFLKGMNPRRNSNKSKTAAGDRIAKSRTDTVLKVAKIIHVLFSGPSKTVSRFTCKKREYGCLSSVQNPQICEYSKIKWTRTRVLLQSLAEKVRNCIYNMDLSTSKIVNRRLLRRSWTIKRFCLESPKGWYYRSL